MFRGMLFVSWGEIVRTIEIFDDALGAELRSVRDCVNDRTWPERPWSGPQPSPGS